MILIAAALVGQQIAKFESREPAFEVVTAKRLEDVERCMIRFGGPPIVYRQPDRPDFVTIVWVAASLSAGNAAGRVDLQRTGKGTSVRSWLGAKELRSCAQD